MGDQNYITINKYGKTVFMPKTEGTNPEALITQILESIGIYEDKPNSDGLTYKPGVKGLYRKSLLKI